MLFRWNQHVRNAMEKRGKGCAHFWAAIRLYGKDAFSHEVLETCGTLEAANAAEERWIEELGTRDPERGFNLAKGGSHTPHPVRDLWDRPEYRAKQLPRLLVMSRDPSVHEARRVAGETPEARLRRSETSKELWTDEHRAKMSSAMKKAATPEVRRKISNSLSGRKLNPERKLKAGLAFKGKTHSLETRAKISSALSGKTLSPEHRASISEGQKGKVLSAETRAKIGDVHRGKSQSPERRRKQSEAQKGRILSPEVYVKIAASCKATRERKRILMGG